ncbi:MAG: hypothetical protein Q9164_004287 [Protoblastenia rupestris]
MASENFKSQLLDTDVKYASTVSKVTSITRDYYDSATADTFYHTLWGGQNICVGIYDKPDDPIALASQRTVERMAAMAIPITAQTRVIDMGAGYGGSARYLAKTCGCHVTCLNLSPVQNERNKQKCQEEGLEHLIDIVEGAFEDLPLPDHSFDLVWSQDAFAHSGDRERVIAEIDRVLVSHGGKVVFTDITEKEGVDREGLKAVLKRVPLDYFGTVGFYHKEFASRGLIDEGFQDWTKHMTRHYGRVLEELEKYESDRRTNNQINGEEQATNAFEDNMKNGLRAWVEAGSAGNLIWGAFNFSR